MKIFFPVQVFFPSQAGGPANSVYWLAKNLMKNGFEPTVVSTDLGINKDFPRNRWMKTDAGRVIFIKTRIQHFPFSQIILSLLNFYRADIVQISSIFFPTAFATALAARLLKKTIVWSSRGELDPAALTHSNARKRPILWAIKNFIGNYPIFHSTCDEETVYIKTVFGADSQIIQIPNYLEVPPPVERNPSNFLLYIGRIHPKKAIDNLIRALAESDGFLDSDFVLKIAGTGKPEFENELKKLVEDLDLHSKVVFVGQVEGAEKQKLLADAYFTIMPSHTENFGVVVLESLAQSTPVIASKGTPWASLEAEQVGFWVENSSEKLGRQIDQILKMDQNEYLEYRERSRPYVEREFDVEKNIDKWVNFYRKFTHK